jgi:hypothetical protein
LFGWASLPMRGDIGRLGDGCAECDPPYTELGAARSFVPRRRGFMAGTGGEAMGLGRGDGMPPGRSTRGTEEVEDTRVGSEIIPRVTDFLRSRPVRGGGLF